MSKEKKSSLQVMDEFAKKMKSIRNSESFSFSDKESKNTNLKKIQNKISEIQNAQEEKILSQYKAFVNPVSKEIEEDENELLECFEEFLKINFRKNELNDEESVIFIKSSIPKKTHYTSGTDFIYLRAWFKYEKEKAEFVPTLVKNESGFFRLTFIPAENAQYSIQEKHILNLIESKL